MEASSRTARWTLVCRATSSTLDGFAGVFRIAPPLTVSDAELAKGLEILDQAFEQVLAEAQV